VGVPHRPAAFIILGRRMSTLTKTCAAAFAAAALLTACGGGNDDDPTPSDRTGVLTVTDASASGYDGVYGNGSLNLTDVDKINPIGSDPEVCSFKFDGANRVAGDGTALGDVRYRPDMNVVYLMFITINGREFSNSNYDGSDTEVQRSQDRIRLDRKTLTATDSSGATVRVSGLIPMRGNRPSGC
jgi:hypothetical protein